MLDAPRPFLGVTRSVTGRAWVDRLDATTTRTATAISQRSGISEILARIIAARGVSLDEAAAWLEPTLRGLMPDPSTLTKSEEHTSELQSLMRTSYAVFC